MPAIRQQGFVLSEAKHQFINLHNHVPVCMHLQSAVKVNLTYQQRTDRIELNDQHAHQ